MIHKIWLLQNRSFETYIYFSPFLGESNKATETNVSHRIDRRRKADHLCQNKIFIAMKLLHEEKQGYMITNSYLLSTHVDLQS